MAKKIVRVLLILLIIAAIGIYVADIVVNGASITKNLFRMLVVVLALAVSLIRTFTSSRSSHGLSFYEKTYENEIGGAFDRSPNDKKKLLTAIRYYNENKLKKAAKHTH